VYQRRFERCWAQFETHTAEVRDLRLQCKDLDLVKSPDASMGKKVKSKRQKEVDQ
jgi:hypothetical protein